MGADMPKSGTGDEIARIDLGVIGEMFVEDDGDPDHYVSTGIVKPDGTRSGVGSAIMDFREEHGDVRLEAVLEDAAEAREASGGSGPTDYGIGIFVCDDCSRSWPKRKNQTPDRAVDTCPDCGGDD